MQSGPGGTPRALSIKAHLIAFGLLCFLPAFVAAAVVGINLAQRERERVRDELRRLADGLSLAVEADVSGLTRALQALATSRVLASGDYASFRLQAERVAEDTGSLIALRELNGVHILNTVNPPESGLPRTTVDPVLRAADQKAIATRGATVSDLHITAGSKRPMVSIVLPIVREGEVRALLSLSVAPQRLIRLLRIGPLADAGWVAAVTGSDGRVIARTRDQERFAGAPALPELVAAFKAESEGTRSSQTLEGTPVLIAFRVDGNRWATAVAVPEEILNAPVRFVVLMLGGAAGAVLALTLASALVYGRLMGRDLGSLADNALRMQKHLPMKPYSFRIREVAAAQQALTRAAANADELLRELDHRVKNTLSVVQAIAGRTVSDPRERRTMGGRVAALTRAHEALSQARWEGVALERLLRAVLDDVGVGATLSGPRVILSPRATTALAQVFQELADNASVHGVLAAPGGGLDIRWTLEGDALVLNWAERDGAVGERVVQGFGLKVVDLCIVRQLNGRVEITPARSGWTIRLSVPLESPLGLAVTTSPTMP